MPPDVLLTTFRFDDGTTANDPACGAYEADMAVLVDDTFVVIDDVLVVMDCNTAVELTAIGVHQTEEQERERETKCVISQLRAYCFCFHSISK